ncbi:hypothetical protein C8J57DRAFT_1536859 [Mycena rebaudengoi]|nr:hypothetical protein C8J57DRAFT_1536859 [Mycena rebaudengoi]
MEKGREHVPTPQDGSNTTGAASEPPLPRKLEEALVKTAVDLLCLAKNYLVWQAEGAKNLNHPANVEWHATAAANHGPAMRALAFLMILTQNMWPIGAPPPHIPDDCPIQRVNGRCGRDCCAACGGCIQQDDFVLPLGVAGWFLMQGGFGKDESISPYDLVSSLLGSIHWGVHTHVGAPHHLIAKALPSNAVHCNHSATHQVSPVKKATADANDAKTPFVDLN